MVLIALDDTLAYESCTLTSARAAAFMFKLGAAAAEGLRCFGCWVPEQLWAQRDVASHHAGSTYAVRCVSSPDGATGTVGHLCCGNKGRLLGVCSTSNSTLSQRLDFHPGPV
jgi:isoaspartyl peptidase/L-asparaginase-like protein (Ntn-hydrolase superfamily)